MARLKLGTRVSIADPDNVPISLRRHFVVGETVGTVSHQVRPNGISGYGYSCDVRWELAGVWGDTLTRRHDESELNALE